MYRSGVVPVRFFGLTGEKCTFCITEKLGGGNVNLCMAGRFDGAVYFPAALTASFFYDPDGEYNDKLSETFRKEYVKLL